MQEILKLLEEARKNDVWYERSDLVIGVICRQKYSNK